jgi:stage V sporulation protein B
VIKKELIRSALAVSAVSAIMSTVGMLFRTYTSNRVGAETMGLLQLITSVYYPACTFASSGVYVAATNLCARAMARHDRNVEKIVTKCLIYGLSFSMAAFLALYFGAGTISRRWLDFPDAEIPLKILSYGLPFLAASNALQGFFLSLRKATYSTVLQISEDLLKIGSSVLMFTLFEHRGPDAMLLAMVAGTSVGEIGSCIFGYILYRRKCHILPTGNLREGIAFSSIAKIALPCAFSAYLRSGIGMVENVLVPKGLQSSGLTAEQTLSVLGKLEGMALPILTFPATFLSAVSRILVPEIAAENAIGHKEGNKRTNAEAENRQ